MSDSKEETSSNYLVSAFVSFCLVGLLTLFWPNIIPFSFFEFWHSTGPLAEAVALSWPFFAFGVVWNLLRLFTKDEALDASPFEIFGKGVAISAWAGIVEEICFRWLLFFSALIMIPVLDWLLLGFIDIHIIEWIYTVVLCPIANFFTFGILEEELLNQSGLGWVVGAAIISSNGRFREGHAYQGLPGYTISWFAGMFLFYLMFHYGLVAAIVVHFLYDFLIFTAVAVGAALTRRRRGFL